MLTTLNPSATHTNRVHGFNPYHIVNLRLTNMVEMVVLQTTCTRELTIEDMPIKQHHLDHYTHIVTNETFTIESQPGQVIGFIS